MCTVMSSDKTAPPDRSDVDPTPHDHGITSVVLHRQPMFSDRAYTVGAIEDAEWNSRWNGRTARLNQELPTFDRVYFDRPNPRRRLRHGQKEKRLQPTWKRLELMRRAPTAPVLLDEPRIGVHSLQPSPRTALAKSQSIERPWRSKTAVYLKPSQKPGGTESVVEPIRMWPKEPEKPGRLWCREAAGFHTEAPQNSSRKARTISRAGSLKNGEDWNEVDEKLFQIWWSEKRRSKTSSSKWIRNHQLVSYENPKHSGAITRCGDHIVHIKGAVLKGNFETPKWLPPLQDQKQLLHGSPNLVRQESSMLRVGADFP